MKIMKEIRSILIVITLILFFSSQAHAYSPRHHLINMGKTLIKFSLSPLYGLFIKGPQNVKKAYLYEVYGREKPEKRGRLPYKLFALWRAPGEQIKGTIDGVVDSVEAGGQFLKEFLSIFFSD